MYLARLEIENFRLFGSVQSGGHLDLELAPGLNLVAGENDSGKTAIIDAIRLLVGTASNEWFRLAPSDFHRTGGFQAHELSITGWFKGLDPDECAALLEYLTVERISEGQAEYHLKLTYAATRREESTARGKRMSPVVTTLRAGNLGTGKIFDADAREILRAIYLRPLRDATEELAAKQGSRLSQILYAHPHIQEEEENDWDGLAGGQAPRRLVGIAREADSRLKSNPVIVQTQNILNTQYLAQLSLGDRALSGSIGIRSDALRQLLERMELKLDAEEPGVDGATRGLGINNLLFMATEFLLLGALDGPYLPLVLIEEPEAHLHPQLQLLLIDYLEARCKRVPDAPKSDLQVILTCHSPNLASRIDLRHLILLAGRMAFRMDPKFTRLSEDDYEFLRRFLDTTKASLFFARGVLIVEGDAEQLLLPEVAKLMGRSLVKYATTIVNVGHVGLFRYARIFQRQSDPQMPVRVACIADRDIVPVAADFYVNSAARDKKRKTAADYSNDDLTHYLEKFTTADGGPVRTFVSDSWTLEHDLALFGLAAEMHAAIQLAIEAKISFPNAEEIEQALDKARTWVTARALSDTREAIAAKIYQPLYENKASKTITAQLLAQILEQHGPVDIRDHLPPYLIAAIDYATGGEAV